MALNGHKTLAERHTCQQQPADCPVIIFLHVNMPVVSGLNWLKAYQHQVAQVVAQHIA